LVVFGGGGYNIANVARTWALVASTLVDYHPPQSIPASWQKLFEALVGEKAPDRLESEGEARSELSQNITAREATHIMQELKRLIPLLAG
jgi:acetoin utilization deacetylase AcuC-like enzyme